MEMSDAVLRSEVFPQNPRQRGRPNTGVTPRRCFRMSDRESSEVLAAAEFEQMTLSAWMRKTLYRTALNTG